MALSDLKFIELPQINDHRGSLTFIESGRQIPFEIKRAYYLYDLTDGTSRAGHGHKALQQLMIAMSGSFNITLDDGFEKKVINLNCPYRGLYIPPMIWRNLDNFSSGAVCMVLASAFYSEEDYFRNYDDFLSAARKDQR